MGLCCSKLSFICIRIDLYFKDVNIQVRPTTIYSNPRSIRQGIVVDYYEVHLLD